MIRELSVQEQKYQTVMAVLVDGWSDDRVGAICDTEATIESFNDINA